MSDLDRALELLHGHEKGLAEVKQDRGGRTLDGVTQATYNAYRRRKSLAVRDVARMTVEERREIYRDGYWLRASCDKLPWPLSYATFDAAVNSGPKRAAEWLQQGLGVPADGVIGPKTIAAAHAAVKAGNARKVRDVVKARADFVTDLVQRSPSQAVFIKGWTRRLMDVLARCLVDLVNEGG
jgi:lysozyme family protein